MKFFKVILYCLFVTNLFSQKLQKLDFTEEEQNWIKNNPTVYFGYDPNWPPYEMFSNGKYTGICNDYIQIIAKKTGINFQPVKNYTWEMSFQALKDNKISMVPGAGITKERKEFLIFTENYIKLPWVIVTKQDNPNNINHLSDLNFKKVSIPRDYMQNEVLERDFPNIKLILRDNFSECLKDVSTGVSEATVGSSGVITYFMNETGSTDLGIACYTHYKNYKVAFAFPQEQVILRNIVQKALKTITLAQRHKIHSKWVTIKFKKSFDYSKIVFYTIISTIIFFIIFIMFFIWNKSLRKQIYLRTEIEKELSKTLEKVNKQNDDKTVLLQEIHHRVKNNLQIIISLLRLQANTHINDDVKEALNEAVERVNSISLVHEHIYKNPNLAEINLTKYIQNLGEELKRVFIKDFEVKLIINTNETNLNIKPIIPLALILNELMTNSLKYAFKTKNAGTITIDLFIEDNKLVMDYSDDGVWYNNTYSRNFGTYLIEIFTEQLNGTFIKNIESNTTYHFEFHDY
ncbi:MAG: transporter substrate-binding domain-containing protein [Bacteroidota bacterium]